MPRYERLADEEWLEEQYIDKDLSQREISKIIGCAQTAVSRRIRQFDLQKPRHKYPELDHETWLREKHHEENLGLSEIADMVGCTRSAVGYAMRRNDIEVRRNTMVNSVEGGLNPEHREIIVGELLGDGCIPTKPGNGGNHFSYGTSREKYRDWLSRKFNDMGIETNEYSYLQDDDRDGWNETMTYRFDTHSYFCLRDLREWFYPDGKKIVPPDLFITPLVLRHLYIGDGSYQSENTTLTIYTDGFDTESAQRLKRKIQQKGIPDIRVNHRNSLVLTTQDGIDRFFDYMAELPSELSDVYGYKW